MTPQPDPRAALATPPAPDEALDAAWEQSLRQALRALPPDSDPTRLAALEARVLSHWQAAHAAPRHTAAAAARLPRGWLRQRWVMVSGLVSGMALSAMLALGMGVTIPGLGGDPALEELMQMDVLSQMAIGEM